MLQPYRLVCPCILLFALIGVYTVNNSKTDMLTLPAFTAFGYAPTKFGCEPSPFVLGFMLGPLMEENLRRSTVLSRGEPLIFVRRPISLVILLMAVGLLLVVVPPQIRSTREKVF